MVTLKHYPHTMTIEAPKADSVRVNGHWTTPPASEEEPVVIPCRFERNNKGAVVAAPDGSEIVYSGIVWLKRKAPVIIGQQVRITEGEKLKALSTVKQIDEAQTTNRLWL